MPRLVIDLDGGVHRRPDVHEKDMEIDAVLRAVGLPILRLTNEEAGDIGLVKEKVLSALRVV